jgi:hypothetical protein
MVIIDQVHCFYRVVNQIYDDLLQLNLVGHDGRQFRCQIGAYRNTMTLEIRFQNTERVNYKFVHIYLVFRNLCPSKQCSHIVEYFIYLLTSGATSFYSPVLGRNSNFLPLGTKLIVSNDDSVRPVSADARRRWSPNGRGFSRAGYSDYCSGRAEHTKIGYAQDTRGLISRA